MNQTSILIIFLVTEIFMTMRVYNSHITYLDSKHFYKL